MSRVLLVKLDQTRVTAQCKAESVGVSVIEPLSSGGVRLVCMSSDGAEHMRHKLKAHLIDGVVTRERFRPVTPLW